MSRPEIRDVPNMLRGRLQRMAVAAMRTSKPVDLLQGGQAVVLSTQLAQRILFFRPLSRLLILIVSLGAAVTGLLAPWYQKIFVDTMIEGGASNLVGRSFFAWFHLAEPLSRAIIFAFLAMLMSQTFSLCVRVMCSREGSLMHAALAEALYKHTLSLTSESRGNRTVGEIVNLYAQDVSAAVSLLEEFLSSALSALVPLAAAPFFVSMMLQMPLPVVMSVTFSCMLILMMMSWRQSGFFTAFKRLAGERLAIVNEWLQNMRIIRILDWTEAFEQRIFKKREEETLNRLGMVTNGSVMNSIAQVAPLLINTVGILVLIDFRKDATTGGDLFALMWVFGVFLARPIRNTPWTLVMFLDGVTSCRRLERFFAAPVEALDHHPAKKTLGGVKERWQTHDSALSLEVKNMNLKLGQNHILKNISFSIAPGEFIAITGEVGVGKTQFLLSLLRDNAASFDSLKIGGQEVCEATPEQVRKYFVYVPQDGFVMSATLRENTAFLYDASRGYDSDIIKSLDLADFNPSRENLATGLDAEIGERGVNLSGGQRQRVGLARAHYIGEQDHERGLVLLDDCLNAVDIDTEAKLIERLLVGAWKSKTRILVTHRLSVLSHADQVWVLENGQFRVERRN